MSSPYDRLKLICQLTAHGERVEVRAKAPHGECRAETAFPPKSLVDQLVLHDPAQIPPQLLRQVGQALHQCLMAGDVVELAADLFQDARLAKRPVHLELRFDPDQTRLARYPWEIIADDLGRFLLRDGMVDLTRYISYPQPPPPFEASLQGLPILQVVSQPTALRPVVAVDLAVERVERLLNATFEHFQRKLLIERMALWGLHFDGHGALALQCPQCGALGSVTAEACRRCSAPLAEAEQVGVLAFERDGRADWISTAEIGSVLYNAQVQLALLLACETARVGTQLLFNGLAPGLILAGVPAVIGMQHPVADTFARNFANAFYGRLLRSNDLLDAMRTARTMTYHDTWYSPALYLRCQRPAELARPEESVYGTRSMDAAAPAEVQAGSHFLARLWIRRPETASLTQEQLQKELGIPTPVPVITDEAQGEIRFEPIHRRTLRRGEVEVECHSPVCDILPDRIKLFVDEHLDAPPAIFTVCARETGRISLQFTVWQDGGAIAAVALPVRVIGRHERPEQSVKTASLTVPVQDTTIKLQAAEGTALISKRKLVVEAGPQVGSEFPLSRDVISVGRSSANDLVLDDPSLSRHHAQLRRHAQGWMIADLGSTNGTLVNGVRVTGAQLVQPGDRIQLGECILLLAEGELAAPTSAMAVGPQFLEEPSLAPLSVFAPSPPEEAAKPAELRREAPEAAARPAKPQAIAPPAVAPSQAAGQPGAPAPVQRKGRSAGSGRAMTALALSAVYVVGLLGALSVSMVMLTSGGGGWSPISLVTATLPVTAVAGATPVSAATPMPTPIAPPPPPDFEASTIVSSAALLYLAPVLWTLIFLLLVVVVMLVRRRRQRRRA